MVSFTSVKGTLSLPLERLIGFAAPNTQSLTQHPANLLTYIAGSTIVLYDYKTKTQLRYYSNRSCRAFACTANSRCGGFVAAGEADTVSPDVIIFELSSERYVATLSKGHKHGIGSIHFSPDGRLVATTGSSSDGQLCVWEWRTGQLLCRQALHSSCLSACFTEDGAAIITSGKEHFKVWSLSKALLNMKAALRGGALGPITLAPKPVTLKELKGCTIVDVKSAVSATGTVAAGGVYCLTSSGVLVLMRATGRTMDKSVNLQVSGGAFALAVSSSLVACACASGVVRVFMCKSLAFKLNLPRMESGEGVPVGQSNTNIDGHNPDAVAVSFDSSSTQLAVMYSDRSLVLWDIKGSGGRVGRLRCLMSHSAGIWGAVLLPTTIMATVQQAAPHGTASAAASPAGLMAATKGAVSQQLVTCSSDGSIRIWSLGQPLGSSVTTGMTSATPSPINYAQYARTLKGMFVAKPMPTKAGEEHLCQGGQNLEKLLPVAPSRPVRAVHLSKASAAGGAAKGTSPSAAAGTGREVASAVLIRCLQLSPDGKHVAAGDAAGNLHIFDVQEMKLVVMREAHESEVLSLSYSPQGFLASGGRDGTIHVFDSRQDYELVNTLDEHVSAVTAVRFTQCGTRLLSCGADRSVIFRKVTDATDCTVVAYHQEQVPAYNMKSAAARGVIGGGNSASQAAAARGGVLYDLALDALGLVAVVVGQDGCLRVFDVESGHPTAVVHQDVASPGDEAVRVVLDSSGTLAVCACGNGTLTLYELGVNNGRLIARSEGSHGEAATSVMITEDNSSVVSVGLDGCIMQWKLPSSIAAGIATANRVLKANAAAAAAATALLSRGRDASQDNTPMALREAWGPCAAAPVSSATASATLLRLQQGKPLLSVDKLPRWAVRPPMPSFDLPTEEGEDEGILECEVASSEAVMKQAHQEVHDQLAEVVTSGPSGENVMLGQHVSKRAVHAPDNYASNPNLTLAAGMREKESITNVAVVSDGVAWVTREHALGAAAAGGAAPSADQLVQQILAARLAQVKLRSKRQQEEEEEVGTAGQLLALPPDSKVLSKSLERLRRMQPSSMEERSPPSVAAAAAAAAAPIMCSGADGSASDRPWADDIEDDDEIVYCSPCVSDGGQVFDVQGNEEDPGEEDGNEVEDWDAVDEAVEGAINDPVLLKPLLVPPPSSAVPSGGDSNWVTGELLSEKEQALREEGAMHQCVKRDLFRDHFGSLDQQDSGVTGGKHHHQQDSRRQSLTATYRKMALKMLQQANNNGAAAEGQNVAGVAGSSKDDVTDVISSNKMTAEPVFLRYYKKEEKDAVAPLASSAAVLTTCLPALSGNVSSTRGSHLQTREDENVLEAVVYDGKLEVTTLASCTSRLTAPLLPVNPTPSFKAPVLPCIPTAAAAKPSIHAQSSSSCQVHAAVVPALSPRVATIKAVEPPDVSLKVLGADQGGVLRQPSPLRVRQGNKMEVELAKMRERLHSLQKQFQRQHAGRSPSRTARNLLQQEHSALNVSQQALLSPSRGATTVTPAATNSASILPAANITAAAVAPTPLAALSDVVMQEARSLLVEPQSPLNTPEFTQESPQPSSTLSLDFTPTPIISNRLQQPVGTPIDALLSPSTVAAAAAAAAACVGTKADLQENPMYNCSPQSSMANRQQAAAEDCAGPAYNNAIFGGMTPEPSPLPLGTYLSALVVPDHASLAENKGAGQAGHNYEKLEGGRFLNTSNPSGSEITMAAGVAAAAAGNCEVTEACSKQQQQQQQHVISSVQHSPPTRDSPSSNAVPKKMKLTLPGFRSSKQNVSSRFISMSEMTAAMAAARVETAGQAATAPEVVEAAPGHVGPSDQMDVAASMNDISFQILRQSFDPTPLTQTIQAGDTQLKPRSVARNEKAVQQSSAYVSGTPQVAAMSPATSLSPASKGRGQYLAALRKLNEAAAEVAGLWAELQVGPSISLASSLPGDSLPAATVSSSRQAAGSATSLSFLAAHEPGNSCLTLTPPLAGTADTPSRTSELWTAAEAATAADLQVQFQQEVSTSFQMLAAVIHLPLPSHLASGERFQTSTTPVSKWGLVENPAKEIQVSGQMKKVVKMLGKEEQ